MTVTEPAPAKLNLALHVRGRRPDGYHELETLFAFCTDGDRLAIARADRWSLAVAGPFASALTADNDNLVSRAARVFAARFGGGLGYAVSLEKRLPVASGIGGGSADAAATLRALARLNAVVRDDPALFECARQLGADVPACLLGRTAIGRGRGELLEPVAGPAGKPVLLVNPGVPVSTARVFAGWDGTDRGPLDATDLAAARNDLEPPARVFAPVIDLVLTDLAAQPGAGLVRMSGSGATCFALFDQLHQRDAAAAAIAAAHPDWWQLASTLA